MLTLLAALLAADPSAAGIRQSMPGLLAIYRDLHAHPELGFQEKRSAGILGAEARKAGFTVTEGVAQTGVVAVLRNGPGPTVLVRTDMDGLPVTEETGLPFASKVRATTADGQETGVMHACGHDTHMTAWIATARALTAAKDRWSGTLVMIGQPAEEGAGGAKAMLADGLITRFPRPDTALAFHDSASLPAGQVGFTPGFALAAINAVDIDVRGVGGHGAAPATTKDPIVLAARIVTTLQTLASREVDPQDALVVTVGSIHGGTKHNIIPDSVKLQLTVRSYSEATREKLLDGIRRIARGEAIAAGMPDDRMPVVTIGRGDEATFNDEALTGRLATVFRTQFGEGRVEQVKPAMVSEDFGAIARAAPGRTASSIFWVGGVPKAKWDAAKGDLSKLPSLHSAQWAPDAEAVIGTAAEAMTVAVLNLMKK